MRRIDRDDGSEGEEREESSAAAAVLGSAKFRVSLIVCCAKVSLANFRRDIHNSERVSSEKVLFGLPATDALEGAVRSRNGRPAHFTVQAERIR